MVKKILTSRHRDLICQHIYLTSGGRKMSPYKGVIPLYTCNIQNVAWMWNVAIHYMEYTIILMINIRKI